MKAKYALIYAGLGVAFLAVSLWVLLSGGRSAKAIRAKYRLGGAMLAAWAMLSASMCEGPGPFVTCYDAVMPEPVTYTVQGKSELVISSGDIILASVEKYLLGQYEKLYVDILQGSEVLQRIPLETPQEEDGSNATFALAVRLPEGTKGDGILALRGIWRSENGAEQEELIFTRYITLH